MWAVTLWRKEGGPVAWKDRFFRGPHPVRVTHEGNCCNANELRESRFRFRFSGGSCGVD